MAKSQAKVAELVDRIERGEIRLPEMQRRFVWRATRVRDLLDSLYRGYPSGSILIWETDEEIPTQSFSVAQDENVKRTTQLLLDGQQRLTSLSAVLRGEPVHVRGRKRPIDILFNLEHPDDLNYITEVDEESSDDSEILDDEIDSSDDQLQRRFDRLTFVVKTNRLAAQPHWISVTEVMKSTSDRHFLERAGVEDFKDPRYEKYAARIAKLRAIKDYEYRMDILERGLSYEEVTEIFVRVNSLGAKLRSSDLALAQITAKWRNSLKEFQRYQEHCKQQGFDLDLGNHLRMLVAMATGQSRFATIGSRPVDTLRDAWDDAQRATDFAMNVLRSCVHITSPSLLSSPFLIVSVGFFGRERDYRLAPEDERSLVRWLMLANTKGRYSRGSSETLLDQDLALIRKGGNCDDLIELLRTQVGRLEVLPQDLKGRNPRSSYFKSMFLAFQKDGARDWWTNLPISLSHSGSQHQLQFHHIFPQAQLKSRYDSAMINDISNLAFIEGKTNRTISDKEPSSYLMDFLNRLGPTAFEAQCIPVDPDLWCLDAYEGFLVARRDLIAKRLSLLLDVMVGGDADQSEPLTPTS